MELLHVLSCVNMTRVLQCLNDNYCTPTYNMDDRVKFKDDIMMKKTNKLTVLPIRTRKCYERLTDARQSQRSHIIICICYQPVYLPGSLYYVFTTAVSAAVVWFVRN